MAGWDVVELRYLSVPPVNIGMNTGKGPAGLTLGVVFHTMFSLVISK